MDTWEYVNWSHDTALLVVLGENGSKDLRSQRLEPRERIVFEADGDRTLQVYPMPIRGKGPSMRLDIAEVQAICHKKGGCAGQGLR